MSRDSLITGLWTGNILPARGAEMVDRYAAHVIRKHATTAAGFRAAADAIEAEQAREEATEWAQQDELDPETEAGGAAVRAMAGLLRRMAAEAERGNAPTPGPRDEPLIVSRFDVAIEPAPEEQQVLTVGAIAKDGRPVALLFDEEARRKVAGWLTLDATSEPVACADEPTGAGR